MTATFSELGIKPELISALTKQSINSPTAIQSAAIPLLLENKNAYLQAETGTGKTLAYLLPIYSKIDPKVLNAQAIVVAPTHELAIQIQRQCTELSQASGLPIRVILLIGGTSIDRQLEKLKKKPHIIIGSVGRIHELIEARKLKTHLVKTIVIDEADRLLASENSANLEVILKATPRDRNTIFVSATELPETDAVVSSISPNTIKVKTASTPVSPEIEHLFLVCQQRERADYVRKLIHALKPDRSIVFTHKSQDAEIIARKLAHHKMRVIDIHGTRDKADRKKAMDQVHNGKVDVLIASDIAARGLDIKGITHIINYDVPSLSEAYLHRVGRTGRAGQSGIAVSLITKDQIYLMNRYEKDLDVTLNEIYLERGEVFLAKD